MKRILKSIMAFASVLIASNGIAQTTFNYTGSMQTYVVPGGVTTINIEAWGAQGGEGYSGAGGKGGYVTGDLAVTPGQTLNIYVGGAGGSGLTGSVTGGWNGGGNGVDAGNTGAGGGGATDIRIGGTALTDRVVVAGGGGGGCFGDGGGGGGLVGWGGSEGGQGIWATGGTQTAGGTGGLYDNGSCAPGTLANDGTLGVGGDGVLGGGSCGTYGGAGGGGGYYGGGGMQINGAAGGSSYLDNLTNASTIDSLRLGDGEIIITEVCTVSSLDLNVTQVDVMLTSDQTAASYQWLDCDAGYAIINGETNQSFTSTVTGNFAVEVTVGQCIDTSACFLVDYSSFEELEQSILSLFPNPTEDQLVLSGIQDLTNASISIISFTGEVQSILTIKDDTIDVRNLANGVYLIQVVHSQGVESLKFIKK